MTLDNLTSPSWWVTAVIGAIALKITSDYVRQGLEKLVSSVFRTWNQRSKVAKDKLERTALMLASDSEMRARYYRLEIRYSFLAIMSFVMGTFFMAAWAMVLALAGGKFPSFDGTATSIGPWEIFIVNAVCGLCVASCIITGYTVLTKSTNVMIRLQEAERIRRRSADAAV
ncbi:hypothetical protein WL99_06080 [Burkholderia cepacia]|uniref:hypothetical protein n=1 Tax=Burkholderia TaxID=32008 RepID=UPI00076C8765|nr:hypothetical protein [Burkholderia cepacia]KWH34162.1 hypothetical protein WL99_06080 [Burkholderia cepacia]